jgi:hypothetical protein
MKLTWYLGTSLVLSEGLRLFYGRLCLRNHLRQLCERVQIESHRDRLQAQMYDATLWANHHLTNFAMGNAQVLAGLVVLRSCHLIRLSRRMFSS